jgi:general secretion pathway protein F/type IV pilus assembly protein PilC
MSGVRTFYYRVLLPHGRVRSGLYRIAVERDSSAKLRLENEFEGVVVTLWRLPALLVFLGRLLGGFLHRELRGEELAGLLRDLGVMMRAGIPQMEALRTVIDEEKHSGSRRVGRVARHLHDDLDAGASVGEAFDRRPDIFPETVRNLVTIGDRTGSLDRMLLEAAGHVQRMRDIRRDIRTALIYPAFVFATIIAVAIFWIVYVVPALGDLFRQLNAELPAITTGLVAFSHRVTDHALWILAATAVIAGGATWLLRRHQPTRAFLHAAAHRLPVARVLATSSGMAALTEHLAILVRSGQDLVTSLTILEQTTSDLFYCRRLALVREAVTRGQGVGASMREVGGFPAMAVRMIAVGEESGTLDEQLALLAEEYRQRLAVVISSIAEILKPVIILVAGGMFLFLVIALLLPVYDLIRQAMELGGGR